MKKCPSCAEEIQNKAKKCRYCGKDLRALTIPAKIFLIFIVASFFLGLIGYILEEDGSNKKNSPPKVPWKTYSPAVKELIDNAAFDKDCPKLQNEFDAADRNSEAHRARFGVNNAKLMDYIDKKMEKAGCYK